MAVGQSKRLSPTNFLKRRQHSKEPFTFEPDSP